MQLGFVCLPSAKGQTKMDGREPMPFSRSKKAVTAWNPVFFHLTGCSTVYVQLAIKGLDLSWNR